MPLKSVQPDFFNSLCTFCQSFVCCCSCVFIVTSSIPVPPRRVICTLLEPRMPAAIICENSFSALKEELLYGFPLNLGFHYPASCPMRRFCIAAIGIGSSTAANLSLTRMCQSAELEPARNSDLPLTRTCQSSEPVPESKPDNITSRSPEHKGVVFTKSPPKTHYTSLWPKVPKIVRGLGISYGDDDFHCPMDYDTPENHIQNQSKKLEPDNSWSSEPTPTLHTKLLVKLLSMNAKLPTRRSKDPAGYDLYSCEPAIIPPRTRKFVGTGILIAPTTPSIKLILGIFPRISATIFDFRHCIQL